MAEETPKKKKTIPLPPKKEEPATPAPAAKQETLDEKIARLEKEAKLAKLEKEAAARNRPPIVERAKETVVKGVVKGKEGIVAGAKGVGKGVDIVKQKTGMAPTRSPITGRMVEPPSLFERGITSLADVAGWFADKAKTAVTPQTIEDKITSQYSAKEQEDIRTKRLAQEAAKSAAKRNAEIRAQVQREEALGPEGRAREKLAQKKNIPEGKKLVISKNSLAEAVVDKNIPDIAVKQPLDGRVNRFKLRLESFLKKESPWYATADRQTVPTGALEGARARIARMTGGENPTAEDFIVKSLNRSKMFTPEEVTQVARQLVADAEMRPMLEESGLFTTYERPNSRLSGGAPKPIDKGTSKFTTIQDDFGNEVKITPKGRPVFPTFPEDQEPSLATRLERFKGQRADTARTVELIKKAEAEAVRNSVAPYGGKGPSVATGPQAQLELRNEIETRQRALAAQRAEAELAKQAARARIEGANNQAEQAFLARQARERDALRLAEGNATWDIRTPEELTPTGNVAENPSGVTRFDRLRSIAALNAGIPYSPLAPTNLGRMDRLREIAMLNAQTPEEYAYLKWLHTRAPLNNISTAGGAPLRGVQASSAPTRFFNMGRVPSLGGIGAAGGAVGGVLAPLQIYEQIKSFNSSDPIEAGYGAVDPFALRGLYDLILDPTVGGMTMKQAGRSYERKANDPRYIEKSPVSSAVGQAVRGNPAYLKGFINNFGYYGDSPAGWGFFDDESPRNLNESR